MIGYYDKHGQPLDFEQWILLHEDDTYCVIGRDEVGDVLVSTVWLGYPSPNTLFETMVFWVSTHTNGDLPQVKWATLEEAQAGHKAMVEQQREAAGER